MPTVRGKENEPFEVAMRRFKRTVEKTGLLTELRAREFYEKAKLEQTVAQYRFRELTEEENRIKADMQKAAENAEVKK